jgi:hypothetical protein
LESQEDIDKWYYLKQVGSNHVNGIALDQVNFLLVFKTYTSVLRKTDVICSGEGQVGANLKLTTKYTIHSRF